MSLQIDGLNISFPARSGYLTICRLNAGALGSAAGFDVDELDDLRLAITEAATWLLSDEEAGGDVELRLSAAKHGVRIDGLRSAPGLPHRPVQELSEAILGATVDEFRLVQDADSGRKISLTKQRTER